MKYIVLGTAGHIDHGKSSLIKELTGTDPDRLPEEKERHITIDIGFAHLKMGDIMIGFVDVPGHERFVRNMLAGIGGVDGFLMVISAVEGIREQTREHAEILRLLGIRAGIVAVSQVDLPGMRPQIVDECRSYFTDLFATELPVVRTSIRTGEGLSLLREELQHLASVLPERSSSGIFRLAIDRVFSLRGAGTVVTGTAIGGTLRPNAEIEILPGGIRARVRQIQVYGEPVQEARAGQRVALNLHGVGRDDLRRGQVIVTLPGTLVATNRLITSVEEAGLASRPLQHGERVRVCTGTAEVLGRCYLFSHKQVEPGAAPIFAEIRLEEPLLLLAGDPFILRSYSPIETHGGGVVIENIPFLERRHYTITDLQAIATGQLEPLIRLHGRKGVRDMDIVRRRGSPPTVSEIDSVGSAVLMLSKGSTRLLILSSVCEDLEKIVVAEIDSFHSSQPLKQGISVQELAAHLRIPEEELQPFVDHMSASRVLKQSAGLLSSPNFTMRLSAHESNLRDRIEELFRQAGMKPLELSDVERTTGQKKENVQQLIKLLLLEKKLVRISSDFFLHAEGLKQLASSLAAFGRKKGRIGIAEFKGLTGTSRKLAIPLLEFLDRQRLTRREKDERIIL